MAAYWIAQHTITQPANFEDYLRKAAPIIAKNGGRYLTRAGSHKLLEVNRRPPDRVVIIEFPDMGALNQQNISPSLRCANRL